MKKFSFCYVFLVFALGCSNNEHLTERLGDFQPIQFAGKTSATVKTLKPESKKMKASCDRTTTDVLVSLTGEEPWVKIENYPNIELSQVISQCQSTGAFEFDVLQSKMMPWFKWGQLGSRKIYFVAMSGEEKSSVSELEIKYSPGSEARSSTQMGHYPTTGRVTNGSGISIRYKIGKPHPSLAVGGVYQVKKTNSN